MTLGFKELHTHTHVYWSIIAKGWIDEYTKYNGKSASKSDQ